MPGVVTWKKWAVIKLHNANLSVKYVSCNNKRNIWFQMLELDIKNPRHHKRVTYSNCWMIVYYIVYFHFIYKYNDWLILVYRSQNTNRILTLSSYRMWIFFMKTCMKWKYFLKSLLSSCGNGQVNLYTAIKYIQNWNGFVNKWTFIIFINSQRLTDF